MSKLVKELVTDELRTRYAELNSALWVELVGADGNTTNEFRGELRERQMCLEIVKNSLFRRACGDGPLARLAGAMSGPSALLTGGESLIDVAKLVEEWMKRIKGLRMRGAVLEGEYLDEARVGQLSKMPTKEDLQARLASLALAPGGNLLAAILSGGGSIAGCLKTLIEKLEKEETPAAA
ncbi:MAG: 50S ribosomal protein L10 [Planctomycetes bacterium]|nr:50S ribosomal protein L10 [Planctomycetota bacterium]